MFAFHHKPKVLSHSLVTEISVWMQWMTWLWNLLGREGKESLLNIFFSIQVRNAVEAAIYLLMLGKKNKTAKWQTENAHFWRSFTPFESMFPRKIQILTCNCSNHYMNSSRQMKLNFYKSGAWELPQTPSCINMNTSYYTIQVRIYD